RGGGLCCGGAPESSRSHERRWIAGARSGFGRRGTERDRDIAIGGIRAKHLSTAGGRENRDGNRAGTPSARSTQGSAATDPAEVLRLFADRRGAESFSLKG